MKNIKIIFTLMILAAFGLGSCSDDLAQPPVVLPEGGIGTGAWNSPMTVYQVSLGSVNDKVNNGESAWVKGYIVGYVNVDIANVLKEETATFTVPATVKTNILLAADPDERDWTKCIPVQLPSGPVRSALNLGDHPDNQGKLVCIKGQTGSKYCSAYGLRSASAYNWGEMGTDDGSDVPTEPVDPTPTPDPDGETIYSALPEDAAEIDWTFDNVSLGEGLSYVWSWKEYSGKHYLNASAYLGGIKEALAYAYSPEVSLEGYASATLTFDHAAKFRTTITSLGKVVVREAGTQAWTEFDIPVWPTTDSWAFVSSGAIDISTFAGKNVEIGFKYESTSEGADTWEIKNVKVSGVK